MKKRSAFPRNGFPVPSTGSAYNPAQSWQLLAKAEHWEHLAAVETSSYFEECNTNRSSDLAKSNNH
jgi:hypothetical protein